MIFRELEKSQKILLDSFKIKTRLEHNTQNTSEEEQSEIGMKGYVKGFLYTKISIKKSEQIEKKNVDKWLSS